MLDELARRTMLVIPLDDQRRSFRFHHLLSEHLSAELDRRDPARRRAIHREASDWLEASGDVDGAISHALRGGDVDRAAALVAGSWALATATGQIPTVEHWIEQFSPDQVASRPVLMAACAFACFGSGRPGTALEWLARARAALPDEHPDDVRGASPPFWVAIGRAIIEPVDTELMTAEARYAYDHADLGPGHPLSCFALGVAA